MLSTKVLPDFIWKNNVFSTALTFRKNDIVSDTIQIKLQLESDMLGRKRSNWTQPLKWKILCRPLNRSCPQPCLEPKITPRSCAGWWHDAWWGWGRQRAPCWVQVLGGEGAVHPCPYDALAAPVAQASPACSSTAVPQLKPPSMFIGSWTCWWELLSPQQPQPMLGTQKHLFLFCFMPELPCLLLHWQLLALQHPAARTCSSLQSTHQKYKMKRELHCGTGNRACTVKLNGCPTVSWAVLPSTPASPGLLSQAVLQGQGPVGHSAVPRGMREVRSVLGYVQLNPGGFHGVQDSFPFLLQLCRVYAANGSSCFTPLGQIQQDI